MKKIIVYFINLYKKYISPAKPKCCRFYPTCSTYAMQAVEKHGAIKGSGMAAWRILRCNPFCRGGIDEVH